MDAYLEHATWVRNLAYELVRDASAADDLAQETWLAYLKENLGEDRPVRPWLAAVLRNRVAMRYRSRANRKGREQRVAAERDQNTESTDEVVARAEQYRHIAAKVLALPEPYRTTLLLRYYEGLSTEAIAVRRDIPPATVRTHVRRGLQLLSDELTREQDGDVNAWVTAMMPLAFPPKEVVAGRSLWPAALGMVALGSLALVLVWGPWRKAPTVESALPVVETEHASMPELPDKGSERDEPERQTVAGEPVEHLWRLLDADTGEALAQFPVRVKEQTLSTDGKGELTLPASINSFEVFFEPGFAVDSPKGHSGREQTPSPARRVTLPDPKETGEVTIAVGPRLDLRTTGGLGAGVPMFARLDRIGRTGLRDDGNACPVAPLVWGSDGSAKVWFTMWPGAVAETEELPEGQYWLLQLGDDKGFWSGHKFLKRLPDTSPGGIEVPVQNTGVIEGAVDPGVGIQVSGQRLTLSPLVAGSFAGSGAVVGEDLRYRIPWVPPGKHKLVLDSPNHESFMRIIELGPGELSHQDISLRAIEKVGPLKGVIRSQSGIFRGTVMVFITDMGTTKVHGMSSHKFTDEPTEAGASDARPFELASLPVGDFLVHGIAFGERVSIRSVMGSAKGQIDPIELLILDQEKRSDWLVEVRDSETQERLNEFVFELNPTQELKRWFRATKIQTESKTLDSETQPYQWSFDTAGMTWKTFQGATPLVGMSESMQFKWWVNAEGFEPKEGTQAEFEKLPSGQRRMTLYMERQEK